MEEVCERENCKQALKRVKANKGSPGVDGMTVHDLPGFLQQHWPAIREQLLSGTYKPQPVKREEIDKPDGSGVRKLGIPTVLDRFIQQAVMQVLQKAMGPDVFRSQLRVSSRTLGASGGGGGAAVHRRGISLVVDLDLEKFFDRVSHDKLMAKIAERVSDSRLLKLIRAFLQAGVMEGGLVSPVDEGTPQGGPLSPLLSNLVLDEFDRELERRGHRFARYADDSNIYVAQPAGGGASDGELDALHHDEAQAQGERARRARWRSHGNGSFWASALPQSGAKRRIAPKAVKRFKERVRELTSRTRGISIERMAKELTQYLEGWIGYFGKCQTPSVLKGLEEWIRRRLRSVIWKQWKRGTVRFVELRKRGVGTELAAKTAGSAHGPWRLALTGPAFALPNAYFDSLGIPRLTVR